MTNAKNTKKALLLSALSLLLCFTMLLGTTFAWFTDSVTSSNNIIKSGNLDITLEYWNGADWVDVKDASDILTNDLWEPGATEVAYLRVANAGTLALKYRLGINVVSETDGINAADESFKLSDYLQFGVVEGVNGETGAYTADATGRAAAIAAAVDAKKISEGYTKSNALYPVGNIPATVVDGVSEIYLALVVYMPEDVDNDANYKTSEDENNPDKYRPLINLGINVVATQVEAELDSFGDDYDANAPIPATVASAEELVAALATSGSYILTGDIAVDEKISVPAGAEVVLDLNGFALSAAYTEAAATCAIQNKGDLTIKNGTVTYEGVGDPNFGYGTNTINNTGKLVIDNAAIINTTATGSSVAIDCSAGADLTVKSGLVKSEKNAIRLCPFGNGAINCTIEGGTIIGARAIQIQLPSNKPAEAPVVNLTVTGGTLSGTSGMSLYSYSYGQSFENVNVTITGGTFTNDVCFGGGAYATVENVTITGGTFDGYLGRYLDNNGWEDIVKP